MAEDVRLCIGIARVGAGAVGDDGLVEALLELAAQAVDAAFGFFGKLLLRGAVFDGADVLAHLEFEFLHQRCELGFEFAGAVAKFDVAFAGQLSALLIKGVLLLTRSLSSRLRARKDRRAGCRGSGRCRLAASRGARGRRR